MNAEQRKAKNTAATGYGEGVAALDGEDQWTCTPGSIAEVLPVTNSTAASTTSIS